MTRTRICRAHAALLALLSTSAACASARLTALPEQAGYIDAEQGVRLHYEVWGRGSDTTIIPFGTILSAELRELGSGQTTLIFYDPRSRGRSSSVADSTRLGLELDVQDIETVRRHFSVSRPSLIGFSYLGAVVALHASRHPDAVRRLVLIAPLAPTAAVAAAAQRTAVGRLDSAAMATLTRATAGPASSPAEDVADCRAYWGALMPIYAGTPAGAARSTSTLAPTCDLPNERPRSFTRVLRHVFATAGAWDWRDDARRITAPTLVIQGDADLVAPAEGGYEWARLITSARLVRVRGSGHMVWAEQPDAVRRAIREFYAY